MNPRCIPLLVGHSDPSAFFHTHPAHSAPIDTCLAVRWAEWCRPLFEGQRRPPAGVVVGEPRQLLPSPPRDRSTPRAMGHRNNTHDDTHDNIHDGNTSTFPPMARVSAPSSRSEEQKLFFLPFYHLFCFFCRRLGYFFHQESTLSSALENRINNISNESISQHFFWATEPLRRPGCSLPLLNKQGKKRVGDGVYKHSPCQLPGNQRVAIIIYSNLFRRKKSTRL